MIAIFVLLINYLYFYRKINKNNHGDYNAIGKNIYNLFSLFLNFKQNIVFSNLENNNISKKILKKNYIYLSDRFKNNNKDINRLFLISNHVNILDCINIQNFISTHYYEFNPIYIMTDKVKKMPIYGKWVSEHCILLKNNINYDKQTIINICEEKYLKSIIDNKKYIFVLFPEGCIRTDFNINRNKKWCAKNKIKSFKYSINPRITGFNLIYNHFKPQKTILSSIIYLDDLTNKKSKNIWDIIKNNIASICYIYVSDISKYIKNTNIIIKDLEISDIYNIWKLQDILLYKLYNINYNYKNEKKYKNIIYIIVLLYFILYIIYNNGF